MVLSLRGKIALGIILCGLLPAVVGLGYTALTAHRRQQDALAVSQENALRDRNLTLSNQTEQLRQMLLTTARNPAFLRIREAQDPAERALWKRETELAILHLTTVFKGMIDTVAYLDENGTELARVAYTDVMPDSELLPDAHDNDYFRAALEKKWGEVAVVGPYVSQDSGRPVVAFATPIVDEGSRIRGVLHFEVPLAHLQLRFAAMSADITTVLANSKGQVFINGDLPVAPRGLFERYAEVAGVIRPLPGVESRQVAGKLTSVAVASSDALPDSYLIVMRADDTWGEAWQSISRTLGVLAASLLLLLIVSVFFARTLSRPILRIKEASVRVARGDLTVDELPIETKDEVGDMTRSFNHMVRQLRDSLRELRARGEELEQRSSELLKVNQLKSEFLATMSHELRTPMNGIIGYTQVLLDGLDGPLTPEQQEDLDHIGRSAERLLALINDILDISKIEAGRIVLTREKIGIAEAVEDVYAVVAPAFSGKQVRWVTDLPPDLPPVYADPQRLRQILLNLVANAFKFTDQGYVKVYAEPAVNGLAISVEDSGPGIPPEAHEYIFEAFRQVDGSSTRKQGGTGLGLAITKRLVDLHGGTIELASSLGHGSTFTITLPAYGTPTAALAVVPLVKQPGQQRAQPLILIVDDDQHALDLVTRFLEPLQGEVHTALTAASGRELALALRPDLVVLDIQLPDATGWGVLAEIRACLGEEVLVVMLSVVEDDPAREGHAADAYLVKPVRKEELLLVADSLLRSQRLRLAEGAAGEIDLG